MKAWVVSRHGGSEVLEWKDIERLPPPEDETWVRVEKVALNHLDVWVRKGVPGHRFPLPLTPGCDIVGTTEDGTRVLLNPILSCGKCSSCLKDSPATCAEFGLLGETRNGGCAEFVSVPKRNLIPIPSSMSSSVAAALPIAGVTALHMLRSKANVRPGEWILVHAAGSGVSQFCISLSRLFGAHVVATSRSKEKLEQARAIGAEQGVLTSAPDWHKHAREIVKRAGRRGYDVVIDHVGAGTLSSSLKCLDWGGKLVTCGATSGSEVTVDLKAIFFKNLSLLGSTMGNLQDLMDLLRWVELGEIHPTISEELPLSALPQALEKLENGEPFGKIILSR